MASGLVLTYQTSGIFNFAHGAIAFTTAFFYYQLHAGQGVPIVPAAILSVLVFAPLLGLLLDRILLRRLAAAPVYARIVGTIGLLVALPNLALWLVESVGDEVLGLNVLRISDRSALGGQAPGLGPQPPHVYRFGWLGLPEVHLDSDQLAVFVSAALAAVLLWYVVRRTRVGLEMRAVVDREHLASLRGVNRARTSALAWTLTMMLAGLGGILIAPLFQLNADFYTLVVLGSLAAVAASGLKSIPIAFAAGLALGVVQNLVAGYGDQFLPSFLNNLSGFKSSIPYILTFVILVVVAREQRRQAGSVAEEAPPPDHRAGLPAWRRRLPWVVATLALVAFSLQWIDVGALQADNYEQTQIAIGLAGAIVAVPIRRLGAVALALGTIAVAFFADLVVFGYEPIGKGSFGWFIRSPSLDVPVLNNIVDLVIPGSQDKLDFSQPAHQVLLLLVLFGALTLVIHALQRSPSGRAMLAVRSSDVAARTSGISPARQQIAVFALAAGIAGFGGAMLGMVNFSFTRTNAPPLIGLVWLAVAVTFGVRRPGGALLAGLAFACTTTIFTWIGNDYLTGAFKDLTTSPEFVPILFGLGAINLTKNPDGLLALIGHQRVERRRQREHKTRIAQAEAALHGVAEPVPAVDGVVEREAAPTAVAPVTAGTDGTAPSEEATLALRQIVAGYGDVEVLHQVDVEISRGSILALLGANGAGKSTLCAVASGLLAPTRGTVVLHGRDITGMAADERARHGVLLVPEARGIFPGLTVEENLRILLRSADARDQAYTHFPVLGERRRQLAGLLSGGEQQMLSLAPALAEPPDVFIADEPTLGLAPLAAEVVVGAIRELRERGAAVLLVEEKAREVMQLADIVAFMELGRVVWMGARDDADADRLAATYLGASLAVD